MASKKKKMNNTIKVALAATALVGQIGIAHAGISADGPSGLLLNPTAEVAPKGTPTLAADYRHYKEGDYRENVYSVAGVVGITDNAEISGGFRRHGVRDGDNYNDWNLGGKYQVLNKEESGLQVAVGANYYKYTSGGPHSVNVYTAATKAFNLSENRPSTYGTLGLRYNDYQGGGDKVDVYAGVVTPLTQDGKWWAVGELGSKRAADGKTVYAAGICYSPIPTFRVAAGVARNTIVTQISYQFGK